MLFTALHRTAKLSSVYSCMHILQRVTHSCVFVLTGSVPLVRHPNWRQATLASLAPKLPSFAVPYLPPLDKTSSVPEHPFLRRIWLPQDGAQLPKIEFWRLSRSGAATVVKDSFNYKLRHRSMVVCAYALANIIFLFAQCIYSWFRLASNTSTCSISLHAHWKRGEINSIRHLRRRTVKVHRSTTSAHRSMQKRVWTSLYSIRAYKATKMQINN